MTQKTERPGGVQAPAEPMSEANPREGTAMNSNANSTTPPERATFSRRLFLRGTGGATFAVAAVAAVPTHASPTKSDTQNWLDSATSADRAAYYACRLAEAMNEIRPGNYFVKVDHEMGFAMIVDHAWKSEREGPLRPDDVTGTNDYAEWDEREKARQPLPEAFIHRCKAWPRPAGGTA